VSPLRIVILVILFYLLYRLLFAGRIAAARRKKQEKEEPQVDVLQEDPVCGRLVPSRQAVVLERKGEKHYFCSRECRDSFRQHQGEE
jgi:YHS domain-containing protein